MIASASAWCYCDVASTGVKVSACRPSVGRFDDGRAAVTRARGAFNRRRRDRVDFVDRTLTCRECNQPFIWTAGEQQFYQEKGLLNIPARCPDCRAARKARLG